MRDLLELRGRSRDRGRVAVADRGHPDAAAQVEEAVAVDVCHPRAVGVVDVDREHAADTAGNEALTPLVDLTAPRPGHLGAQGGSG